MHTENSHLCEIITNFAGGVSALNGLTANTQYFATGTSGTDFAISSATDTHTFNLPTASATNRGALSSADWSTFSGKVGGSGASGQVAYWNGTSSQTGSNNLFWNNANANLGIGSNAVNSVWKLGVDGNVALTGSLSLGPITGSGSNAFLEVTASQFRIYAHTSRYLSFSANANEYARLQTNGNFILGSTFSDGGQRLQVQGDAFIKGSGATSATSGFTIQNSASTELVRVDNSGQAFFSNRIAVNRIQVTSTANQLELVGGIGGATGGTGIQLGQFTNATNTSGTFDRVLAAGSFLPTSGTGLFNGIQISATINQTGGANGITRGLYVNPTLTAAADWRSIEWSNNSGWGLYGAGTAPNWLGGNTTIRGSVSNSTTIFQVQNLLASNALTIRGDKTVIVDSLVVSDGTNKGFTASYAGAGGYQFALIVDDSGVRFTNGAGASRPVSFNMNTGEILRIDQNFTSIVTNNFLVGTTTNAGFKLDVNGTARVSGAATFSSSVTAIRIITQSGNSVLTSIGNLNYIAKGNDNNYSGFNFQGTTLSDMFFGKAPNSDDLIISTSNTSSPSEIIRFAQNGRIGINTTSISASAILQADSTTRGFLPPRMTNAQRTAIGSPAVGLIVYCTDATEGLYQYINNAWVNLTGVVTNRQTASYTLALGDSNDLVEMNVATANNLTVPLNSSVTFPIGTKIDIAQYGAGQTTVVATGGVTVRSAGGALKLAVQYSGATLVKIGTDEWYLFGDITV
jgi:hypothetical protein